jgi:hypothetical protein
MIAVSSVVSWWASAYSDHRAVSVTIRFLHIAGLVVAGGTAIATDRTILLAAADATRRPAALITLSRSHYTVVPALALIVATGVLMTAADTATFFASPVYCYGLVVAERLSKQGKPWKRLAIGSAASLFFWFVLLLLGTWLTVAA